MEKSLQRNGLTYPVSSYRMITYVQAPINYAMYFHYSPSLDDIDQKSLLWEELYLLARDTVKSFYSDFYWDMVTLEGYKLNKNFTFYYLYGDSGTTIVDKADRYSTVERNALACSKSSRPNVYRVELVKPEKDYAQQWPVFFTCLATEQYGVIDYSTNSHSVVGRMFSTFNTSGRED